MGKIIRITEAELKQAVKRILQEQIEGSPLEGKDAIIEYQIDGKNSSEPVTFEEIALLIKEKKLTNWKIRPISIVDISKYAKSNTEDSSPKFPQDYEETPNYHGDLTAYALKDDEGKDKIRVIGGNGVKGDGITTFELFDLRELRNSPNLTYMSIDDINNYVKEHPIESGLKIKNDDVDIDDGKILFPRDFKIYSKNDGNDIYQVKNKVGDITLIVSKENDGFQIRDLRNLGDEEYINNVTIDDINKYIEEHPFEKYIPPKEDDFGKKALKYDIPKSWTFHRQ